MALFTGSIGTSRSQVDNGDEDRERRPDSCARARQARSPGRDKSHQLLPVRCLLRAKSPPDTAPIRYLILQSSNGRNAIKFYEAGMDLELSRNVEESFRLFQGRILDEYEAMIQEVGFHVIDATGSIEEQQQQMRHIVTRELGDSLSNGVMRAAQGDIDAAQAAS